LNPNPSTGILPVEYRIPNVAGNSSGPGHAGKPAGIRKAWIPGQRGRKATVFSSFRSEDEALRRLKPRQWRNSGVEQRTDAHGSVIARVESGSAERPLADDCDEASTLPQLCEQGLRNDLHRAVDQDCVERCGLCSA